MKGGIFCVNYKKVDILEWLLLVLGRAFFISCKDVSLKVFLSHHNVPVPIVAGLMAFIPAIIMFPYALMQGQWSALENSIFVFAILGNVFFNVIGYLLYFSMIKKHDISYVTSISATSPLVFSFMAFILLGETLSGLSILFIFILASGCVFLEKSREKKFVRKKIKDSAWIYLILYMLCAAVATVFSKLAVTNGPVEAYIGFRYILLIFFFFSIAKITMSYEKDSNVKTLIFNNKKILLAGVFLLFAVFLEMNALRLIEIGRVEALTKVSLILTFSFEAIFLKKSFNMIRLLAIVFILLGGIGMLYT